MRRPPVKIGIAGTHSTGKSTFLTTLAAALAGRGLKIGRVNDLATRARDLGFPILTEHTFESTLWIMAEGMRQEAEASLVSDVILIDRPVPDALGYLLAALQITGRTLPSERLERLKAIAGAYAADYDLLIVTELDRAIALGEGRDRNEQFREAAARHIDALMSKFAPGAMRLTSANGAKILADAEAFVLSRGAADDA